MTVDDEPGFIRLLKFSLERTGNYIVREENDATKALEVAEQFKPDLILLDLIMPKMDGNDVAAQLRSNPVTHETPVVFLTATALSDEFSDPAQIDACTVLAKPVSLSRLIRAIEENVGVLAVAD